MSKTNVNELNIYQKLAKIRKQVEVIQKNKTGYGYKYVTDDELLAKITVFMDKYEVSLIPNITHGTLTVTPYEYKKTKKDKDKDKNIIFYEENINEVMVYGEMQYIWVNNQNPDEQLVVDWVLVGHQGDGSQSLGSALTYSMRYFLLKFFNIATPEDDPDKWRSKQKEAESAEDKALAKQIIEQLHELVTNYIAQNGNSREEVKTFLSKYADKGNYFNINDSVLALKLLNDFNEKYNTKKESNI